VVEEEFSGRPASVSPDKKSNPLDDLFKS